MCVCVCVCGVRDREKMFQLKKKEVRKRGRDASVSAQRERGVLLPVAPHKVDDSVAGREVWLLRVPRGVADAWAGARAGDDIGSLSMFAGGEEDGEQERIRLRVSTPPAQTSGNGGSSSSAAPAAGAADGAAAGADAGVNVVYAVNKPLSTAKLEHAQPGTMTEAPTAVPKFFVLSAPTTTARVANVAGGGAAPCVRIEGKVVQRFDVRPITSSSDESYREVLRQRTEKWDGKADKPKMAVIDDRERALASRHLPARTVNRTLEEKLNKQFLKRVVGTGDAEIAEASGKLYDTIFQCFEKRDHWKLQELHDVCQVPMPRLRETLNEVAIKNARGAHANHYELKPEYKQRSKPSGGDDKLLPEQ